MDRTGFEPATSAVRGLDNGEKQRILEDFQDFMQVDLRLAESTIRGHVSYISKYLDFIDKNPDVVTKGEIRGFLKVNGNGHYVKAIRVFYGKYLDKLHLIKTFKIPSYPFKPKYVPSKKKLHLFYRELNLKERVVFLLLATSGLRYHEVMELRRCDLDLEKMMIKPLIDNSSSKRAWVTFFNEEAEGELVQYLQTSKFQDSDQLFSKAKHPRKTRMFNNARKIFPHITPKVLRQWFSCEMARMGIQDRYVDAFCGRVPKSILARHYTDF